MIELLADYLDAKGFKPIPGAGVHADQPCFDGYILLSNGLSLKLHIRFPNHALGFPVIKIIEWQHSSKLRQSLSSSNISATGIVCHSDESITYWDPSDPVESLNHVFWRLLKILNEKVEGTKNRRLIAQDFHGYWDATNDLFLGTGAFSHGAQVTSVQLNPDNQITSCNSAWLLQEGQKFRGLEDAQKTGLKFLMVDLKGLPNESLAENWPPKTVANIFSYLSKCEHDLTDFICNEIYRLDRGAGSDSSRLLCNAIKKQGGNIGLVLRWQKSDESVFGFTFFIEAEIARAICRKRNSNGGALLKYSQRSINRYKVTPASPKYIHTRRLISPSYSLRKKSVLLIGAGAIGSHLAPMLCAMGAGQDTGILTICDKDTHKLGNVSRSALGLNFVGKSKASAIQEQLKISYPYSITKTIEKSYAEGNTSHLTRYDLIIDATGSPEVGIGLSAILAASRTPKKLSFIHGSMGRAWLPSISFPMGVNHATGACGIMKRAI